MYSQDLIVRKPMIQIPEFKNYVFIDSFTYIMVVRAILTSPQNFEQSSFDCT